MIVPPQLMHPSCFEAQVSACFNKNLYDISHLIGLLPYASNPLSSQSIAQSKAFIVNVHVIWLILDFNKNFDKLIFTLKAIYTVIKVASSSVKKGPPNVFLLSKRAHNHYDQMWKIRLSFRRKQGMVILPLTSETRFKQDKFR